MTAYAWLPESTKQISERNGVLTFGHEAPVSMPRGTGATQDILQDSATPVRHVALPRHGLGCKPFKPSSAGSLAAPCSSMQGGPSAGWSRGRMLGSGSRLRPEAYCSKYLQ